MAKHSLGLEILDTLNECILPIIDTSIYGENVEIDCPYLDILVPGFQCAVRLEVEPNFCVMNLTACNLQLQTDACGARFDPLPDGIYAIKYSVSPHEHVYVEYNFLRITKLQLELKDLYCDLDIAGCEPTVETKKTLEELRFIESLISAAKTKVEICHNSKIGMNLYNYAKKRISKLTCNNC